MQIIAQVFFNQKYGDEVIMGIFNSYNDVDLDEFAKQESEKSYAKPLADEEFKKVGTQGYNSMNESQVEALICVIVVIAIFVALIYHNKKEVTGFWKIGTSAPIQRVGLIILAIGILSAVSWLIKSDFNFEYIFRGTNGLPHELRDSRKSFFYGLYFLLYRLVY